MSYDIDEEGNKVFNEEPDKEDEMFSFVVHYSGKVYIEARDEDEAYDKFMQGGDLDPDDIEVVRE